MQEIIKIKSTHPASQGPFVLIYKDEFDPEKGHELYDENVPAQGAEGEPEGGKKASVAELRAALAERGIDIPDGAKKADLQALLDAQG